jgi:hypothetical protein
MCLQIVSTHSFNLSQIWPFSTSKDLCQEYEEFIALTMELVMKINFQPLLDDVLNEIEEICKSRNAAVEVAKDTQG